MAFLERSARRPLWSAPVTLPLASRVPAPWRRPALVLIKTIHTIAFFSISALIGLVVWDGLREDPRRRTVLAALVAVGESAVYGSNNLVCPLTPLAEELGAARGTITDIYLPQWLSRRVPLFGGGGLLLGLVLNVRAARRR
jgi:hypothetical protein